MNRILVYRWINIFDETDYNNLHISVEKWFNKSCPNFGNKLWYQGLISEISIKDNIIEYYQDSMKIEEINERYDMVIYPMANIFSVEFSIGLPKITSFVNQLKIPIYIISCGAQANDYDELNDLVSSIGEVSRDFIKAVYDTGGQFALRGYFTAEFFSKLGFKNPSVVGCPSLYQLGKNINIEKKTVSIDNFKPSFNGKFKFINQYLKHFSNSIFYDQDEFYDVLYNPKFYNNLSLSNRSKKMIRNNLGGMEFVELIKSDRIRLIADMWNWQDSFKKEGIVFSFGGRIHGNIMALLSGVPAVVVGFDTRTREMAELYHIPLVKSYSEITPNDIYDYYLDLDYSDFNKNIAKLVDNYEQFLINCKIVSKMNINNSFLNHSDNNYPKDSDFINNNKIVANNILNKKLYYNLYYRLFKAYVNLLE